MGTKYPIEIDTNLTLPKVTALVDNIKARDVNQLQEAIIAIETELGVNPSGTSGTVSDRLNKINQLLVTSFARNVVFNDVDGYYTTVDDIVTAESALRELGEVLSESVWLKSETALYSEDRNVGILDITPPNRISISGPLSLKHQSVDLNETSNYGKIFTKESNNLVFKNEYGEVPLELLRNGAVFKGTPLILLSPEKGESDSSQFVGTIANNARESSNYNVLKLSLSGNDTDTSDSFLSCYSGDDGYGNSVVEYRITGAGTTVSLTAQHWVVYQAEDGYTLEDEIIPGMILESTGELGIDGGIEEAVPVVKLCSTANSKKVFGVLSSSYNTGNDMYIWRTFNQPFHTSSKRTSLFRNSEYRQEKDFSQYSSDSSYFKARSNSGGEGKIWVSNLDGYIENGDYITSSDIPGYGKLQSDNRLRSSTVAKCTQDIVWENITETIRFQETDYKIALVSCTYHCG